MTSEIGALDIPYKNYLGIVLRGDRRTYIIVSRCLEDGDLLIYHVINIDVDDEHCEAQVFLKCRLPIKLYLSRKRRIQRIKRSNNLREEFELSDAMVLVSRIPEEGIERHRNCQLAKERKAYKFAKDQFPPLPSPVSHHLYFQPQDQRLDCSQSSYAEAASLPRRRTNPSCSLDYLSKTKEGVKQRERRREERLMKNRYSWPGSISLNKPTSTDLWVPLSQNPRRGRSCSPFITALSTVKDQTQTSRRIIY
ncbi:hypothetical protein F4806DRAFT_482569 [Annulohypoxylon nitens]|nr:hypothetical protein F4806DRAFT_482569 [Annulohypoxylon nitens]